MTDSSENHASQETASRADASVDRRVFLKKTAAVAAGAAGLVAALSPLAKLERGEITLDALLQKHYRKLTPSELRHILKDLEVQCHKEHGVRPEIRDPRPMDGVEFGYALNLTRCIGCRRCARACLAENNQSRDDADDLELSYIRVLELDKGAINLETSDLYYDAELVPRQGKYYMPVQCQQCREPPCTKVCPVQATWTEPDGVVVVDYNWCIGCRYCMAACPYDARRFNYVRPKVPAEAINRNQSYLSNRLRRKGVVEKCTFCLHRTRVGKYPACVEVCPTGARLFGNMLDPNSEIGYVLRNKRVYVLKEEVGTLPRFYYFFDA